jgi:hypothetical protein
VRKLPVSASLNADRTDGIRQLLAAVFPAAAFGITVEIRKIGGENEKPLSLGITVSAEKKGAVCGAKDAKDAKGVCRLGRSQKGTCGK